MHIKKANIIPAPERSLVASVICYWKRKYLIAHIKKYGFEN
jgi:hypothetical protein